MSKHPKRKTLKHTHICSMCDARHECEDEWCIDKLYRQCPGGCGRKR